MNYEMNQAFGYWEKSTEDIKERVRKIPLRKNEVKQTMQPLPFKGRLRGIYRYLRIFPAVLILRCIHSSGWFYHLRAT